MNTTFRRLMSLTLILMLLLPLLAFSEAVPEPVATLEPMTPPEGQADPVMDETDPAAETGEPAGMPEETPAPAPADAPEGFEFLKAAKANVNKYYVALRIEGFEPTLYAFTDSRGSTQFRVYGRLNKKKGMYEATVHGDSEGSLKVAVTGDAPKRDRWEDFAKAKVVALNDATLPEGYRRSTKSGVCYFVNLFKQKEFRVRGRLNNTEDAFYPAVYAKPKPGSLAIDISRDSDRFRVEGEKYFRVPRALRGGFAIAVFINTTDGNRVSVLTDKPVVDRSVLK